VPLLSAQLKAAGFTTDIADLNVRFYNKILTSGFLAEADARARADLAALKPLYEGADLRAIEKKRRLRRKNARAQISHAAEVLR
jgi:hypothetical protein